MAKEKFLLVSLNEDKAKKLAQVISNETSRKILDFLADKEATESELAQALNIPISTVHYNLQAIMEGGLVIAEEFHYSEKGKEVLHYKLANKYIIIAPKTVHGIKTKLKSILPVVLIIGAATAFIQMLSKYFIRGKTIQTFSSVRETVIKETVIEAEREALKIAPTVAEEAVTATKGATTTFINETAAEAVNETTREIGRTTTEKLIEGAPKVTTVVTPESFWSNIAIWFLLGALFALLAYFIVTKLRKE